MMSYDLAVIGSGWAGFNAALEAKKKKLKICLIEKDELGGTCLNKGCIPTKTLIHSAKVYSLFRKATNFGIAADNLKINFSAIQQRKQNIIQQLKSGMQSMLKDIDFIKGSARLISPQAIDISGKTIESRFILIASGSSPAGLKTIQFDHQRIISSDDLLDIEKVPDSLLVIGGGVIGCEFACLFNALGTKVTIVEITPQLLPGTDSDIAKKLELSLKKKGIAVNTATDATTLDFAKYHTVLMGVGRTPCVDNLGLEEVGIKLTKGVIGVDDYLKTNLNNIYAAGDCTGKLMLAHYAAYQGMTAVRNLINSERSKPAVNTAVPGCVFTDPEIATVGCGEDTARGKGLDVRVHKFDFRGSGMARIIDETDGFVKIISDIKTGDILGGSIIGPRATELISIFSLAITAGLKVGQLRDAILAHPTVSEGVTEALKEDDAF